MLNHHFWVTPKFKIIALSITLLSFKSLITTPPVSNFYTNDMDVVNPEIARLQSYLDLAYSESMPSKKIVALCLALSTAEQLEALDEVINTKPELKALRDYAKRAYTPDQQRFYLETLIKPEEHIASLTRRLEQKIREIY